MAQESLLNEIPLSSGLDSNLQRLLYLTLVAGSDSSYSYNLDLGNVNTTVGQNLGYVLLAKEAEKIVDAGGYTATRSIGDFYKLHDTLLVVNFAKYVAGLKTGVETDSLGKGMYLESLLEENMFESWLLDVSGLVVGKEMAQLIEEDPYEEMTNLKRYLRGEEGAEIIRRRFEEILNPVYSNEASDNKIMGVDEASEKITTLRLEGIRTAIVFGSWDVFHEGHLEILRNAKTALGKYGWLGVVVSSNFDVKLRKGNARPIDTQETRLKHLIASSYVDGVISLPEIAFQNTDDLSGYYGDLHEKLSPHFRIVGPEERLTLLKYEAQCKEAGIALLLDNRDRLTSTTDRIHRILDAYRDQ